ncbi:unnamed protein product [Cylicocyclus nassatus]|uniref:Uncharacterized protein n=1 Tax=Cylicocyclus nassatus TaxID=53992 RepID=A0AA36DNX5_CYLNA|nr:unnamed protein product [Cylicocyclus nassatus]
MRGCDPIQIQDRFDGVPCTKEGCYMAVIDSETYNVCCCSSDMCNSVRSTFCTALVTFLVILYVAML